MKINELNPVYININGTITPLKEAKVSIFDRGFLFGDSLYEVLRTYTKNTIFQFDRHFERFLNTASLMGMKLPFDRATLLREIYKTTEKLGEEVYVRIIVSRGEGEITLEIKEDLIANYFIIAMNYQKFPEENFNLGITLYTPSIKRTSRNSLNPEIKSGNYLNNILALKEAKDKGYNDALMLNADGYVTELSNSNIFFVKNGVVKTPSESTGILKGVTRSYIIDLCKKNELPIEIGEYSIEEFEAADECFISSTLKEVMPVRLLNNRNFKNTPGNITQKLMRLYKASIG